jgi:hypothetical protein
LYSASGFAARPDDFFAVDFLEEAFRVRVAFAEVFLAEDFFAEGFFAEGFFADGFFAEEFLPAALFVDDFLAAETLLPGVFLALLFFATGRFTVRLRVVAMLASWCEECARGPAGRRSMAQRP